LIKSAGVNFVLLDHAYSMSWICLYTGFLIFWCSALYHIQLGLIISIVHKALKVALNCIIHFDDLKTVPEHSWKTQQIHFGQTVLLV